MYQPLSMHCLFPPHSFGRLLRVTISDPHRTRPEELLKAAQQLIGGRDTPLFAQLNIAAGIICLVV
jgi:hypothetical protein